MRPDGAIRPARVVSVGRNAAWIVFDDETRALHASLPKRLQRVSLVPGDRVLAHGLDEDRAVVDQREPRSFALERRTAGGRSKTMAANVDSLAIVAAFDRPPINLPMVDELLAFAALHELRAILLFTKPDLGAEATRTALLELYSGIGYDTIAVNPKSGTNVDAAASALSGRHSLLIGQSGVGKSSLFRALGGVTVVGELSRLGRGRQTTTSARLHRFPDGFMIDSPGIGEFALHPAPHQPEADWCAEVAQGFVEFGPLVPLCRFTDCMHRVEPGCAVRIAAETGAVAASRYVSYLLVAGRELGRLPPGPRRGVREGGSGSI